MLSPYIYGKMNNCSCAEFDQLQLDNFIKQVSKCTLKLRVIGFSSRHLRHCNL